MKDGFIKVAAATPDVLVANPVFNGNKVRQAMEEAWEKKVKLLVFPELCLSSATCGALVSHDVLLEGVLEEIR